MLLCNKRKARLKKVNFYINRIDSGIKLNRLMNLLYNININVSII